MSSNNAIAAISQAWRNQREHKPGAAIPEFEKILKQDANNVDALYGIGLALRDDGKKELAVAQFQRALELVEAKAVSLRAGQVNEGEHRIANTPDDDRYMMLGRMLHQRLAELGAGK